MKFTEKSISSATNAMAGANDTPTEELEARLKALQEKIREQSVTDSTDYGTLLLSQAQLQIGLEQNAEAWESARTAFDVFYAAKAFEQMADACDAMFLSDQEDSLVALGQGIWLAVTYPIDPSVTLGLLHHVIDETPDDADGAAVAAATARYIVELRSKGKEAENLMFFAQQMLGNVAKRHSDVETQEQFDLWAQRLELNDPEKFLVRLRNVVDVLVQDNWWIDRDALQEQIPVN